MSFTSFSVSTTYSPSPFTAIGDINLHFDGGLDWLYNLLRGMLEIKLKDLLSNQMCKQGRNLINNANKYLKDTPTRMTIKGK